MHCLRLFTITLLTTGVQFVATIGFAQQPDSLSQHALPAVEVTSSRLPSQLTAGATRPVEVIYGESLRQLPIQTLQDVLKYVAGVDVRQRGPLGAQTDVSIRGGTNAQTLVLINGVKVNDPQSDHLSFTLPLQPQDIERIEVLKGPAASVFGQNAFAGVINLITKKGDEPRLSLGAQGGQHDLYDLNASLSLPIAQTQHFISATRKGTAGYQPGTDLHLSNFFYQGGASLSTTALSFTAGYTAKQYGAHNYYGLADQYESNDTYFFSLGSQGKGKLGFSPRIYYRHNFDDYLYLRSDPSRYHNRHNADVLGAEFNTHLSWALGTTSLGAEARQEQVRSNNLGQHTRYNTGVYLEHRALVAHRLTLTPGLYLAYLITYDGNAGPIGGAGWFKPGPLAVKYGWQAFPSLSTGLQLSTNWRLIGNLSRAFRVPTFTELYYMDPSNRGNGALQPEEAWNTELGARYQQGGLTLQLNTFQRNALRLIDYGRDSTTAPWQAQNLNNVLTRGLELTTVLLPAHHLGANFPLTSLRLGYQYLDQCFKAGEVYSKYALNYLKHQFTSTGQLRIYRKLLLDVTFRYEFRVNLYPYAIADARLAWQTEHYTLYAQGTNLTNKPYYDLIGIVQPGRWLTAGASWTLPLHR